MVEERFGRRKFLAGARDLGLGLAFTSLLSSRPARATPTPEKLLEAGVVHFELLPHESARHAEFLEQHFQAGSEPDHVILPAPEPSQDDALAMNEADFVKNLQTTREKLEEIAAKQSRGERVPEEEFPNDFLSRVAEMIRNANQPVPKVKVHYAPWSEKSAIAFHQLYTNARATAKQARAGNFEEAWKGFRQQVDAVGDHYYEAEKELAKYLKKIRKDSPQGKVLVVMAPEHRHFPLVLREQGVRTSGRMLAGIKTERPAWEVREAILRDRHGVEKPNKERVEELLRREFVVELLENKGLTERKAIETANGLSTGLLNGLFEFLKKPGGNLYDRAFEWISAPKQEV